jgi:hypothetical protein
MDYSDYIKWKSNLSSYTGGICPADCTSNATSSSTLNLPKGLYFSDYLFYNNYKSSWEIGSNAVHLGSKAGSVGIGSSSVAIGENASAVGKYSIAIGKSTTVHGNNSIILNATGSHIPTNGESDRFYVNPIRNETSTYGLYYNPLTKEVTYNLIDTDTNNDNIVSPLPEGTTYGQYIYYNNNSWVVGSDQIHLGTNAGEVAQGDNAIAIGKNAGNIGQEANSIAIGLRAGETSQGSNSIAIGSLAGYYNQANNTTVINATGIGLSGDISNALYIKPIRNAMGAKALYYDEFSGEVTYSDMYESEENDNNQVSLWSYFDAKYNIDMCGHRIFSLADPSNAQDAVTKKYVDSKFAAASASLPLGGGIMLGDIDMNNHRIKFVDTPINDSDVANKYYVDSRVPMGDGFGEYIYYDGTKWAIGSARISLGLNAGSVGQGDNGIAVGMNAGTSNQGNYSIALGYLAGNNNQADNTIILNASGRELNTDLSGGFYVSPIRQSGALKTLYYDPSTNEITYSDICGGFSAKNLRQKIGTKVMYYDASTNEVTYGDLSGVITKDSLIEKIGKKVMYYDLSTNAVTYGDLSGVVTTSNIIEKIGKKVMYYDVSTNAVTYGDISGGNGGVGGTIGTNTLKDNTYNFKLNPYGFDIKDGKSGSPEDTVANAFAKIDQWIHNYMIAQPPKPDQIILSKKSTPTSIYVAFTNPVQIKTALFNKKLPLIENVNIDITKNGSQIYRPFDENTKYIPDISEVNAIVISKVNITPAYRTIQLNVSGVSVDFKAYYYYNSNLSSGTLSMDYWYANYSALAVNKLRVQLPQFAIGLPPSIVRDIGFNTINKQSVVVTWNKPVYSDYSNNILSTDFDSPLLYYNLKYKATSTIRYGGIYNNSEYTVDDITGSSRSLSTNIYPGTRYSVGVAAYNSTNDTPGPNGSNNFTTLYPDEPSLISAKTFGFTTNYNYTGSDIIKAVNGNNTRITYPVLKSYNDISSNILTNVPIHYTHNIGSSGEDLTHIYGVITSGKFGDRDINILSFDGFSYTTARSTYDDTSNIVNNADISDAQIAYTSITDFYPGSQAYNQGFYLTTGIYALVKKNSVTINPSKYEYTLELTQLLNGIGYTKSASFGVDDLSSVPSITNFTFNTSINDYVKISGVNILKNNISVKTNTSINNLARYYYLSNELMRYEVYSDSGTKLIDMSLNDLSGSNQIVGWDKIIEYFEYDKIKLNINFNNIFTKYIRFKLRAKNIIGYSSIYDVSKNIIMDTESILFNDLIKGENPINSLVPSGDFQYGRRNKSGAGRLPDISYCRIPYDNEESLSLNNELQIYKGYIRTLGNGLDGYLNYSNYENNSGINYSNIDRSEYRYATFVWNIPAAQSIYNYIIFKINAINNIDVNLVTGNVTIPEISNGQTIYHSFHLFYKFENIDDITNENHSSVWINANKVESGNITFKNNYNVISYNDGSVGGRSRDMAYNNSVSNDGVYKLLMPTLLSNYNIRLYARIGISLSTPFYFKGLTAKIE